jgi:hypothetical protein
MTVIVRYSIDLDPARNASEVRTRSVRLHSDAERYKQPIRLDC